MPPETKVLLVAHDQVLPAPGSLEALTAALDKGSPCAAACDVTTCCGQADYLTLRGFERFAAACRASADRTSSGSGHPPLAMLASLAALADGRWRDAPRIADAWVHDFSGYRTHRREEMLALMPDGCTSILDVGGGSGCFLQAVGERRPGCRTVLIELSPRACSLAQGKVARVRQGDFLSLEIDEVFDCITFLDVLEHVVDPQAMLEKARSLLSSSGRVIASIPNVGHWSVIADLLEGRWDYAPAGIHCITHLRFFTKKGIAEFFEEAGFVIERWEAACLPPPPWFTPPPAAPLDIDHESLATVAWHCLARPA